MPKEKGERVFVPFHPLRIVPAEAKIKDSRKGGGENRRVVAFREQTRGMEREREREEKGRGREPLPGKIPLQTTHFSIR